MIVVDATVLIDFFIGSDARQAAAEALFTGDSKWVSVSLWRYELGNALRTSVRSRETTLDEATALEHLADAEKMVTETIEELDNSAILKTAIRDGLTMYDASYVWAARVRGLKLHTRDSEVLESCPDVALPMP
jgi:predicted nucleic acid-binding protein